MHNEKVHIKSGSKVHEILLDYAVGAGVGTTSVAQYHQGMGIRVLPPEILVPYPLDVVAAELGRIVARAYGHISGVCRHVIDAVRDNLTVREQVIF